MISLQRSMHSSQIYTPGPAMSFLTCFWLFPQNEHFSKSPPSPMRATQLLPLPVIRCGRPAYPEMASGPPTGRNGQTYLRAQSPSDLDGTASVTLVVA